ncbi:MAG: hypothetical protein KKB50_13015 [Planctomycetes bacterium]|nr:hypothetical protein [Planctomycetota bacterium]
MCDEVVERQLRSIPVKSLSAEAEAEIVAALRAAEARPRHWHARPIPLWQTAAACVVVGAATWLSTRSGSSVRPAPRGTTAVSAPPAVFVRLEEPLFSHPQRDVSALDISHWQSLSTP